MPHSLTHTGAVNARLLAWAGYGLLVFVSAFIWAPSRDGLEGVYALAFFIPMLGVLLTRKPGFHSYGGWPTILALTFAAYCVLSSLWGEPDDLPFFILQWCLLAVWLCGVSWLHRCRPINFQGVYQLLAIIGAVIALTTLVEFYWHNPFTARLEAWTVARNPIVVAQVFGVTALLAFVLSWQATTTAKSLLFFVCALCALLPMGLSQSRGPIIAFIPVFALALICIRPRRLIWSTQLAILLLISFTAALALGFGSILAERGISLTLRDIVWLEVLELSRVHPWFGIGLAQDTSIPVEGIEAFHHAHNPWLDTFYRTGILGLALALSHLLILVRRFRPTAPILPLYLWLLFGLCSLLTDGRLLFWQIDAKWFLYWIPAGLIAAALMGQQQPEPLEKEKAGS